MLHACCTLQPKRALGYSQSVALGPAASILPSLAGVGVGGVTGFEPPELVTAGVGRQDRRH